MNLGSFVFMGQKTKLKLTEAEEKVFTEKLTSPRASGTAGCRRDTISASLSAWHLSDGPVSSSLRPRGSQAAPATPGFLSQRLHLMSWV